MERATSRVPFDQEKFETLLMHQQKLSYLIQQAAPGLTSKQFNFLMMSMWEDKAQSLYGFQVYEFRE